MSAPASSSLHDSAIAFVYRQILRREATVAEIAAWSEEMAKGLTFHEFLDLVKTSDEGLAVTEAEALRLADDPDFAIGDAIAFIYQHALGRIPSEDDIRIWANHLDAGLPFQRFVLGLLASEEGRRHSEFRDDAPHPDAIRFVYRGALGRDPSEACLAMWSDHIRAGLPFQRFLLRIRDSEEARMRAAGKPERSARASRFVQPSADQDRPLSTPAPSSPHDGMIAFVYRQVLRREATPVEVAAWAAEMQRGLTFDEFLDLVETSDEGLAVAEAEAQRLADSSTLSTSDAVAFVYRHAVGRPPSEDDLQVWTTHFGRGLPFERFVLNLLGSEEGRRHAESGDASPHPDAITFVYRRALGRPPSDADLAVWTDHIKAGLPFQRFLLIILGSEEALKRAEGERRDAAMPDKLFVAHLYEICFGRCALPREVRDWKDQSFDHAFQRSDLAMMLMSAAITEREKGDAGRIYESGGVSIMGTDRVLTVEAWNSRAAEIDAGQHRATPEPLRAPYVVRPHTIRVSAIASLYRGGRYIRKFLDNMVHQSLGENFELIIIDANSPEGEREVIEGYRRDFPNIRYERINYRIGIYEAWNAGVELARGDYLTNTNLDDLRRADSLELQAGTLDAVPFADIVYQDFFYSLDPDLSFEQVEAFGFRSGLPLVTNNNLPALNSPHNAPMWRKQLHAELGLFDTSFKSAGDHEFWLRCLLARKTFYKINTPHVVYYQNPDGLSTRPGSPGVVEGRRIQCKYGRKLFAPEIYLDRAALSARLSAVTGGDASLGEGEDPYGATQRLALSMLDGRTLGRPAEAVS